MGGASRKHSGHRPQRANHPEPIQTRHSATPLETPPRRAGKPLLLNRKPAHSTNDAAKMQKFASRYRKNWIVVENGSSEHRTTFPASRPKYDLNRADGKRNDRGMTKPLDDVELSCFLCAVILSEGSLKTDGTR